MENSDADRNRLLGILALQNGLVDQVQLVSAVPSWTLQKDRPLADHLVDRGALDADERGVIEAMVALHLKKHGGRPAQRVADIQATIFSTGRSLAGLADPELAASLTGLLGREPGASLDPVDEPTLGSVLGARGGKRPETKPPHPIPLPVWARATGFPSATPHPLGERLIVPFSPPGIWCPKGG